MNLHDHEIPSIDVSVILSCYNAASLLRARVQEFEAVLTNGHWTWELLLCDDGSRDATARIARELAAESPRRRCFFHAVNRGRGLTVRDAIRQSHGRFVGYADVDGSTAAHYAIPALRALESGYDAAEAHRFYRWRTPVFPLIAHRFVAHKLYAGLVRRVLKLEGHDTESGFKFFRREALVELAALTQAPRWFWDTEVIAAAHQLGYRVAEIPALFNHSPFGSTVRLLPDSVKQVRQLLRYSRKIRRQSLRRACCQAENRSL